MFASLARLDLTAISIIAKPKPFITQTPSTYPNRSISVRVQISFVLFEFQISIMFTVGAYFVLHATFLYSQKPPSTSSPSASSSSSSLAATATGTSNGNAGPGGVNEVELPEKESLLRGQSHQSTDSPRTGRAGGKTVSSDGGPLPRKSSSKFSGERDTDPV